MEASRKNVKPSVYVPVPPPEHQFKPGNPGGSAPKGKRISTWMAEFGDMPPEKWPNPKTLSANGRIALARVREAMAKQGLRATELILNRTEGALEQAPSLPMLQGIAAAILALKAAGVTLRKEPIDVTPEPQPLKDNQPPQLQTEEEEESEDNQWTPRLRRDRAREP